MPDPDAQMSHLASALAGRYRVEREVGRGGMAAVYLAEDLRHGRTVAIKVLRPELAAALGRERFVREIEITARLRHPHILPLYDSGEAQGLLFYVMPYVEGESLRDLLNRETQLPLDEAVQITREVADALSYAHSHDVLHRDIKPENILLESGHALVADFGIARAVTAAGGDRLTETGLAVGTPVYMSPEQAGGVATVDARTDVYSLGCVLYEMLAGDPPFIGSTPQAIFARKSLEAPPPVRTVRPAVPPAMGQAIAKALATTPADRFRTAYEFAEALTAAPVPEKPVRRRRAVVGAMTLVAAAAAVVGGRLITRASDTRWALEEAIPRVIELTDAGDHVAAFRLASQVEEVLPEDPTLARLWPQISRYTSLRTEPAGADFEFRQYGVVDAEFVPAGRSAVDAAKIPLGFFHWRIHKPGYATLELASSGIRFPGARDDGTIHLYEEGTIPSEMVPVPGGAIDLGDVPGLEQAPAIELGDYLIDRYEVANREYKAFVDSKGYATQEYWREPFVKDGRVVRWEVGVAEFLDATGRPGPAGWQVGTYPEGQEDFPVGGISWYEAAAYAAFAGKQLPTIYHWRHAADAKAVSAHVVPLSNYADGGSLPVGSSHAVGPYGTYDMAGNVREWCRNPTGDRRYILGGAWGEPSYFYVEANSASPWDRSPVNGMRLMKTIGEEGVPPAASRPLGFRSAPPEPASVPDAVYRVYERLYRYDRTTLDDTVRSVTESRDWQRLTVTFRAAYGNERMAVHLFLPRNIDPPYQVVVYFPGSNAFHVRSSANIWPEFAHFLVRSGRAVAYPIYQGTYERDVGRRDDNPDTTVAYRDLVVMWSKDLRRTIDYLSTREDMNLEQLAYFGFSWGAAMGAIIPALDPRITAVVLEAGGLWADRPLPEADQRTFAPRVTQPVLMLNGRYDAGFPLRASQEPMFRILGTPEQDKRHIVYESGHVVPRNESIRDVLQWLDRYLGPVR